MARTTALPAKVGIGPPVAPAPALYRLLRAPVRATLERWFALDVDGADRLPAHGPYIVAANHHNYLDGVVLGVTVPLPVAFLVMPRVYRATPVHPVFHRHVGSIPLSLERPDVGALRAALQSLERGAVIGIFPEGPFSVRGQLERGLPGVGLLALRSGVPVVPVAIRGTYEALVGRRGYIPRRHPITVRFGTPRVFVTNGDGARTARARVTTRVMEDIGALLAKPT
ncbi:MAG TPA: lysophospholipid acyltransferase family protein [Methylomirabilota bacterium]|jgi:1-acyl-sn-glycerol-3-phosphate acyltransferase